MPEVTTMQADSDRRDTDAFGNSPERTLNAHIDEPQRNFEPPASIIDYIETSMRGITETQRALSVSRAPDNIPVLPNIACVAVLKAVHSSYRERSKALKPILPEGKALCQFSCPALKTYPRTRLHPWPYHSFPSAGIPCISSLARVSRLDVTALATSFHS